MSVDEEAINAGPPAPAAGEELLSGGCMADWPIHCDKCNGWLTVFYDYNSKLGLCAQCGDNS